MEMPKKRFRPLAADGAVIHPAAGFEVGEKVSLPVNVFALEDAIKNATITVKTEGGEDRQSLRDLSLIASRTSCPFQSRRG